MAPAHNSMFTYVKHYKQKTHIYFEMGTKIKNTGPNPKNVIIVTRERIVLEPGEEIEFEGDMELG